MSGVPLQVLPLSLSLFNDASVGLGAHLLDTTASGVWSEEESQEHKCAQNESSRTCSGYLTASVSRAECRPDERQLVICCLSPASGQHGVSEVVSDGIRHHSVDRAAFGTVGFALHSRK